MTKETVFTWAGPPVTFGAGALSDLGADAAAIGIRRALLVTDPYLAELGIAAQAVASLSAAGITAQVYDEVGVEPTDTSIAAAVSTVARPDWDGVIAVGGGSSIDTAKAVNLLTCYPAPILDYVNKPVGRGLPPAGPLKPLIAVPTTAGTGSESTPVCVLDILDLKLKTGISHPALRPVRAILDPTLTLALPAAVTAACGMDVICHALESFTARPYTAFERHAPGSRPAYCGANPISDEWVERTLALAGRALPAAVRDGSNLAARTDMLMAAMFAGMGFGNAGVHIPHACAYPIAGQARGYRPSGYPGPVAADGPEALVPHGQAVSLTAPAAFRHTFPASPARHQRAANLLLHGNSDYSGEPDPVALPRALIGLMREIGIPNGLSAIGFSTSDVPALAEGALRQRRLTTIAPITVTADLVTAVFEESLAIW